VCGYDYNHQDDPPRLVAGLDSYKAGWGGRGDLLEIPFDCENGCKWFLCLGFHKGKMAIFCKGAEDAGSWSEAMQKAERQAEQLAAVDES
jgi:hypothetical protein